MSLPSVWDFRSERNCLNELSRLVSMAGTLHRTGLGSAHTLFLDKIFVAYKYTRRRGRLLAVPWATEILKSFKGMPTQNIFLLWDIRFPITWISMIIWQSQNNVRMYFCTCTSICSSTHLISHLKQRKQGKIACNIACEFSETDTLKGNFSE